MSRHGHRDVINEQFWKHLWGKVRPFLLGYVVPFVLFVAAALFTTFLREGNFSGLTWAKWLAIVVYSTIASVITGWAKSAEKKKSQNELDTQYKMAFFYASKSIFDYHKLAFIPPLSPSGYLQEILSNIADSVTAILEANSIIDNHLITASVMVECTTANGASKILDMVSFGPPNRLNRRHIKLPLTDKYDPEKTLPGAPAAFLTNVIVYIEDINDQKYANISQFKGRPYSSLFSVPITDSEDGENEKPFAVLNVDSPNINHFVDLEFIKDKIYPALCPQIALMKLLRKSGKFLV
jgi:hypothetical protein